MIRGRGKNRPPPFFILQLNMRPLPHISQNRILKNHLTNKMLTSQENQKAFLNGMKAQYF